MSLTIDKLAKFPKTKEAINKRSVIENSTKENIESWKENTQSLNYRVRIVSKKILLFVPEYTPPQTSQPLYYKPVEWIKRLSGAIHSRGEKISIPKKRESSPIPLDLKVCSPTLKKRGEFYKKVAKIVLLASTIFLFTGILVPIAFAPFLLKLSESITFTLIITSTVVGVVGMVGVVANAALKNSKTVHEYEARTNEDFHSFKNRYLNGYNLTSNDLQDGKLFQIYLNWKGSVEKILKKVSK